MTARCRALRGRGLPWHQKRAARRLRAAMQGDDLAELGAAIRVARRASRMTLRDLETASGWSRSMLSYLERGERWSDDAAVDVLAVLAKRMGEMNDCKHEAALRRHADGWRTPQANDMRAAADHIAAQRAEIERLTRERDEALALVECMKHQRESAHELMRQAMTWSYCPFCGAYPRGAHAPGCPGPGVMRAADKAIGAEEE